MEDYNVLIEQFGGEINEIYKAIAWCSLRRLFVTVYVCERKFAEFTLVNMWLMN